MQGPGARGQGPVKKRGMIRVKDPEKTVEVTELPRQWQLRGAWICDADGIEIARCEDMAARGGAGEIARARARIMTTAPQLLQAVQMLMRFIMGALPGGADIPSEYRFANNIIDKVMPPRDEDA